jgi:hypothetical protein
MNPHRAAVLEAWWAQTPRVPLPPTPKGALGAADERRVRAHLRAEVRMGRVELRRVEERQAGRAWAAEEEARAEAALFDTLSRSVRVRDGESRVDYRARLSDLALELRGRKAIARAAPTEEEPSDERLTLPMARARARAFGKRGPTERPMSAIRRTKGGRLSDKRLTVPAGATVEGPLARMLREAMR